MSNKERFLRNKAKNAGYAISKGFVHYLSFNNSVVKDDKGKRLTGYVVEDLTTGFYVWGCYDNCFDHLWSLNDVENFLKMIYVNSGLDW